MKAALFLIVGKGEFVEVWQLKIIVGDGYRGGTLRGLYVQWESYCGRLPNPELSHELPKQLLALVKSVWP